jgi:amidophosphoribosyltransferase
VVTAVAGPVIPTLEERGAEVLPKVKGAFSFVFMDEHTLYAARDPQGIRPLVLGRLERGWVVASETAALDIVGAILHPRGRAG